MGPPVKGGLSIERQDDMLNECKRFYKADGMHVNEVEVSIYYSKGGMNYFTARNEHRGYYFSIQPYYTIECNGYTSRECSAFSGAKACILPCSRQSKKHFEEAMGKMDELVDTYLDVWLKSKGIALVSDEYREVITERQV